MTTPIRSFHHCLSQGLPIRFFIPHHLKIHRYQHSVDPCSSSFVSALNSCRNLQMLKQIHASIIVSDGQEPFASILTSLYIEFNAFGSSVAILESMEEPNTSFWNSFIKTYINAGVIEPALRVYRLMRLKGVPCDGYTFPIMSKLVSLLECGVIFAEVIHSVAMQMGFDIDVHFCNTMIDSYVKSGSFGNAYKLFKEMPYRDLVSWTSMISAYAYEGNANGASGCFSEMRKQVNPNEISMIVMLQSCSSLVQGQQLHGCVIKFGLLINQSLKNSILKMYADFGSIEYSEILLEETAIRDLISWNIMIYLYSSQGMNMKMVDCFNEMRYEIEPSPETFTQLVSGLGEFGHPSQGKEIHCLALRCGSLDDILATSLLDFYAKTGELEASTQLFTEISHKSYITWDAYINGWIKNGYFSKAIDLFQQMLATGHQPAVENMRTLVGLCTHLMVLRMGKAVHAYVIRNFFSISDALETSILSMYVRCGEISSARNCFKKIPAKDLVTWSSMIEGCGIHGFGAESLQLLHQMRSEGIKPNAVTFLSLLSACSHSGLLHQGCLTLHSMRWEFGINPNLDHYTCVVDLLGRSGKIREALLIIIKHVTSPDSRIWGALLAAAGVHEDRRVGEYAAEMLLNTESDTADYCTLFSNLQAKGEKWTAVEEVRSAMKDMNLMKNPGWSCLEVRGVLHGFVSGDRSHCGTDKIYRIIESLSTNALHM